MGQDLLALRTMRSSLLTIFGIGRVAVALQDASGLLNRLGVVGSAAALIPVLHQEPNAV
jgi:hypothetical protein